MKQCSNCKESKETSEFSKNRRAKDGLSAACRACDKKRHALRYVLNRENILAKNAKWEKENKEYRISQQLEYRAGRKEEKRVYNKNYRQEHTEQIREYDRTRYQERKDYVIAGVSMRRGRTRQATPLWMNSYQKAAIAAVYSLARIHRDSSGADYHVDHVIPLVGVNLNGEHVVCGLHVPWNLQVVPQFMNDAKGNKVYVTEA